MTDVEPVAPEAAPAEPRQPCLCGCGATPKFKRSRFMPGHDAQLKASLYRTIRDEQVDDATRQLAQDRLTELGWPQPAPKKSKAQPAANGEAPAEAPQEAVTPAAL